MKKSIIAAALILITGSLSSQVKVDNKTKAPVTVQQHFTTDGKELASGD